MTRQERVDVVMDEIQAVGSYRTKDYELSVGSDHVVTVRDLRTGGLVAYSATRADLADSVAEFVYDFMI